MESKPRSPLRTITWLELRRLARKPMVLINFIILCFTSILAAFHAQSQEPLFFAIRAGHYIAFATIGSVVLIEQYTKDPGMIGMLMARGACREAAIATVLGHAFLWLFLCLPSLMVLLFTHPSTWLHLVLQGLIIAGGMLTLAAATQSLMFLSIKRGWHDFGTWVAPVLALVFIACYLAPAFLLISRGGGLFANELILSAYALIGAAAATHLMLRISGEMPRRKHHPQMGLNTGKHT